MKISSFKLMTLITMLSMPVCLNAIAGDLRDKAMALVRLINTQDGVPKRIRSTSEVSFQLSETARKLRDAVVLVGHPEVGHGTAFVISREHRLLATNAHVADIFAEKPEMYVVRNESAVRYEVEDVWYHPSLIRMAKTGNLMRSANPADGNVYPFSPDVAVLKLKEGADLPEQFEFATDEEVNDLFGRPVAMIGFPGHDTSGLPDESQAVMATFRDGAVGHLSRFDLSIGSDAVDNQLVHHTMSSWFGFSGSPIFLENGHVVALLNSGKTLEEQGSSVNLQWGIRVDVLWELIQHHGLSKLFDSIPNIADAVIEKHVTSPDEPDPAFAEVSRLIAATAETSEERIANLTKAIEIAPDRVDLLLKRSQEFLNRGDSLLPDIFFMATSEDEIPEDVKNCYGQAIEDLSKAREMDEGNANIVLEMCWLLTKFRFLAKGQDLDSPQLGVFLEYVEQLCAADPSPRSSAKLNSFKAALCTDTDEAVGYLEKAIEVTPQFTEPRVFLVKLLDASDSPVRLEVEKDAVNKIIRSEKQAIDAFKAFRKASTESDLTSELRSRLIELSEQAVKETKYKNFLCLDKYAGILADDGQFDEAISIELGMIKLAYDDVQRSWAVDGVYHFRQRKAQLK